MKIGILTHPLHSNYGGILQCYALNTYLRRLGYETIVIKRLPNKPIFFKIWLKNILRYVGILKKDTYNTDGRTINLQNFVNVYIDFTQPIDSNEKMRNVCKRYNFDAIVVGSDQVWREDFARVYGYNYFLDFVPDSVIKISYAASFGLSQWYYGRKATSRIKQLLASFRGVSVREFDGLRLCETYLNISSVMHVDPTMLLFKEDYEKLASKRLVTERYILVYWLGEDNTLLGTIAKFQKKGYKIIKVSLRTDSILPSIEDWLSYIMFADYVITDSFHGCVFSLIFNKDFFVYSNKSGGNGRLKSLLALFDIQVIDGNLVQPDYSKINARLSDMRQRTYDYFYHTLR